VVEARENLALQNKFLELRLAALERAQKQVDAGAMLPLDLFSAEVRLRFGAARHDYGEAIAGTPRKCAAHADRRGSRSGAANAAGGMTEPFAISPADLPDKEQAIQQALAARPDRLATTTALETDDLNIRHATEALRPSVSLTGSYVSQGVGGIFYRRSDPFGSGNTSDAIRAGSGRARASLRLRISVYSFGLRMRIPLRDRRRRRTWRMRRLRKKRRAAASAAGTVDPCAVLTR